jgi:starvation-inducible DNA-binding protein
MRQKARPADNGAMGAASAMHAPLLDSGARNATAETLSAFLASTFILYQKTLFYHWNVTGEHFVELHKLFETHYIELQEAADAIAERIRALGYFAPGTTGEFLSLSSVQEDSALPASDRQMAENLLKGHEACAAEARHVLSVAEHADDEATKDLMIKRIYLHEKTAWMLRAFLS